MAIHLERRWGGGGDNPTLDEMQEALDELDTVDDEHPDTWLCDDLGRHLVAHQCGRVVYEDPEWGEGPRHIEALSRHEVLALWQAFAAGRLEALRAVPWRPGYGPPALEEQRKVAQTKYEAQALVEARSFYDSLGDERADVPCKRAGCTRGAVRFSTLCRPHHFASLRGTCPFEH